MPIGEIGGSHVQQFPVATPLEQQDYVQKVQADRLTLQDLADKRMQEIKDRQAEQQTSAFLQDAFTKYKHDDGSPDYQTIKQKVMEYNPALGMKFATGVDTMLETAAKRRSAELKQDKDEYDQTLPLLRDVKTPEDLAAVMPEVARRSPHLAQVLAADPSQLPKILAAGLSDQEWTKQQEKITGQYGKDPEGAFLNDVSLSRNNDDMQEAFAALRAHASADVVGHWSQLLGQQWTPDTPALAAQHAQTVQQRQGPKATGSDLDQAMATWAKEHGTTVDQMTLAQKLAVKTQWQLAGQKATEGESGPTSDVKEMVSGMIDGTTPPILPGRATKEFTQISAEAHRRGFDLTNAVTDWVATQKHIATLNGAQQTRIQQSIGALPGLLDKVDSLSKQWNGGRFAALNKANLALAKGGAFGSKAASIANQLDAQIADVNADLATVYMGGNSPTDRGLELASKALHADWDEKVLTDMIGLARENVKTRQNSIKYGKVQGVGDENPYAPSVPMDLSDTDVRKTPDGRFIAKVNGNVIEVVKQNGKWVAK